MHAALKQLNTQLSKLNSEVAGIVSEINRLKAQQQQKQGEIDTVKSEIKKLTTNITVSEHAILRYLERVKKIDIDEIKRAILPPNVREQIATLGNGTYPVDGFKIRVRDNVVATITD